MKKKKTIQKKRVWKQTQNSQIHLTCLFTNTKCVYGVDWHIYTHTPTHIQVFVLYLKSIKCHIDSIMTKQTERMVLSTNKPETKKPDPFHHGDD